MSFVAPLPLQVSQKRWLSARMIWHTPMPHARPFDRLLIRTLAILAARRLIAISGIDQLSPTRGPFILALNHNTRSEALLVPALILLLRGGKPIHFLADWNFRLIPGVNFLYRRAQVITLTRKRAKPHWLTPLRALFAGKTPVIEQATEKLEGGACLGVFIEGTVNRDGARLKRGRLGAAALSLKTGVPVVPLGIVHDGPGEHASFCLHIGAPIFPRDADRLPSHHAAIMNALARLCGKTGPNDETAP